MLLHIKKMQNKKKKKKKKTKKVNRKRNKINQKGINENKTEVTNVERIKK